MTTLYSRDRTRGQRLIGFFRQSSLLKSARLKLNNMKASCFLIALSLAMMTTSRADELKPVLLYPEGTPGSLGDREVDKPSLTPFLVDKGGNTAAMVVLPGGGYGGLAQHEGKGYAEWLNGLGISAFVVKYRLGSQGYRHPSMLQDAARAVRLVRAKAKEWSIDPERVGIIGSSAGGHLASTLLTHFDSGDEKASSLVERQSSRPTLGILCYPVITLGEFTHEGSKRNLLGNDPDKTMVEFLSNEKQVSGETPPCFLWHTWEDKAVPVENSLLFATALRKNGVLFDLHVYERGRHGLGLGAPNHEPENYHPWVKDCAFWLNERGFLD